MKTKLSSVVVICALLGLPRSARAEEQAAAAPPGARSNMPAYIALGVAGTGAAIGTIYGLTALGAKSEFKDALEAKNTDSAKESADSADRAALIADISFGIAFASGVTALVLLLSNDGSSSRKSAIVAPVVGPAGGGLSGILKF